MQLELSHDSSGQQSNTSLERPHEQHVIARAMSRSSVEHQHILLSLISLLCTKVLASHRKRSPSKCGADAAAPPTVSQMSQQAALEQEERLTAKIDAMAARRRLHSLRVKEVSNAFFEPLIIKFFH